VSVYLQPEGTVYTYRNLIKLAIEQSDNTASGIIAKALGKEKIQSTIDFLSLARTSYSLAQTTPEDTGRLLVALYQDEILTLAHSQELIGYLSWTIFNDQIPAVLPDDLVVAHKVGFDDQVLHDAAIIFTDQGDFVLVIMSQGDSSDQAQEVLEEITKAVWEAIKD
jgi:beta-lactamase class A